MNAENTIEPSITFLNMTGDVKITWGEESRAEILAMIQEKLDAGYVFFEVETKSRVPFLPILGTKEVDGRRITSTNNLPDSGTVRLVKASTLDDPKVEALVNSGHARLVRSNESESATRRLTTAAEVAATQSVATRPLRGG